MKKFVNFKFVVMFALALVANVASYAQDNVIDEVVWVIGDEAILKSDVEEARLAALYEGRKFDGDPYCVIPEELAVQKLYMHQAVLDSIEVPEAEVIQRVDYQISNYIRLWVAEKEWKQSLIRPLHRFVKPCARMPVTD